MKLKIYIVIFLLISLSSFAQTPILSALEIGDKVPDVTLTNVRNYRTPTIRLSEFKDKLIILDFWDKWCTACINAFPEMERLQNQFGEKIQVLLVARNKEDELKRLFETSPILKSTKLPIVIGDTVLHQLFPHTAVPFHVWLDGNGIVKARTNYTSTTAGNIASFLTNNNIALPIRNDVLDMNVRNSSLLEQLFTVPGQMDQVVYYSLLTKRSKATPQQNYPLIKLFTDAYCDPQIKKIIVEVKKTENLSKYFPPVDRDKLSEWEENNTFQYEIRLPSSAIQLSADSVLALKSKFMRQDLERCFDVRTFLEKRKVKCWVLHFINNKKNTLLKSEGGDTILERLNDAHWIIRNAPFEAIPNFIRNYMGKIIGKKDAPIMVDETKYNGRIDADLTLSADVVTLNKALSKYGLFIKEETREMQCMILQEL